MSQRIFGQPTAASQRVARAMNNPNEPTPCRKCGSIYFMEIPAQMYTVGSYGVRSVSVTPMKVYMCPCGTILTPAGLNSGNQAGGERDLFAQSLAAALQYRDETGIDAASEGFAGVQELRKLKEQVSELQEQLRLMTGAGPIALEDDVPIAEDVPAPAAAEESASTSFGSRGRSEAGSTEASGEVKFVPAPARPSVEGGAKGRMRRQGS